MMKHAPLSADSEQKRLAVLKSYHMLDTLPEKEFDSLVELVTYVCQVPMVLISFMGEKRHWFKASVGIDIPELDRASSFCKQTIEFSGLLDNFPTSTDPLLLDNPFTTGSSPIRFFAGVPLLNAEGYTLGTLCVLDTEAHTLTGQQMNALRIVRDQIMTLLELHKARHDKALEEIANDRLLHGIKYAAEQLITIPHFKKAMECAMPTVGEAAGLSHICIYKKIAVKDETIEFSQQSQWSERETKNLLDQVEPPKVLYVDAHGERWYKQLKEGENIQKLQDLPAAEQSRLKARGVQSVLVIPIISVNQFWGFIRFEDCGKARHWTSTEIRFLGSLAHIMGGAIARNKADEELRSSNKYLENIINAIPAPLFIKDKQHRLIMVNDACCQLNGIPRENMLGKTDFDLFPLVDAKIFWEKEEFTFQSGQASVNEETVTRANKKVTTVITQKALVKNEFGEDFLIGCCMDITDRKQTEKALAKEQYLVQAFMDYMPDTIYFKDLESRFVRVSNSWVSFLGLQKPDDLIGKTDFDFFSLAHAQHAYDIEQRIIKTGVPLLDLIEKETWPDGRITWLSTTKMPLYDVDGNISGTFGISRDITESKEAEIALVNTKNYLNHIFDTAPIPIFVKDSAHRWVFLNDAWCKFTGDKREGLIGKSDYDLYPPEVARLFWERDEIVFNTGQESIHEEIIPYENAPPRTVITKKTRFRDQYGKDFLVGTMIDLTEIKTIETKLIYYHNYLNTIINAVADPIFVKDMNRRLILVNDSFCDFTGLSREHILNKTDHELFSKEEADVFVEYDNMVFESKKINISEEDIKNKKGIARTVITKKTYFANELNEGFLVGSVTDISDRKKAEVALIAKEKYFRSLIQYSTDIISVLEKDGITRFQSPSFYQILGHSEMDSIGSLIFNFIHPEDLPAVLAVFDELLLQPGLPFIVEFRFQKANGDWVVLESVATNWLDDEAVVGIVVNSRDVTERKKVEAEIQDKSQVLHGIISNMPVAVFKTDKNGIFTQAIGMVIERIGMTETDLIGVNILDVFPESVEPINKAFTEGFSTHIASTVACGVEWNFETYLFEDKAEAGGLIGFALDITENKVSERKLQEYAIDLEKINQELDQFAYVISHDLKAPLRAISNLSQWIEEDLGTDLSDDIKGNLALLRSRVNRLQALIEGVLDYSRVNRSKITFEEVNVDTLVKEVIQALDVPETHPIILQTALPSIITNRTRIEQLFCNLISNAIKYHDKPSGQIRISYQDTKDFHQFSVADDGPGIAAEYHQKVFVIFQTLQAKDKVESTGVGLAIVKKIVEDQGGEIWIESEPGQGATFIFTLPKQIKNLTNHSDHDG